VWCRSKNWFRIFPYYGSFCCKFRVRWSQKTESDRCVSIKGVSRHIVLGLKVSVYAGFEGGFWSLFRIVLYCSSFLHKAKVSVGAGFGVSCWSLFQKWTKNAVAKNSRSTGEIKIKTRCHVI